MPIVRPELSVCVATRGEPAVVAAFLNQMCGLRSQRPWELLLVHNAPQAPSEAVIRQHAGGLNLHLLHEPHPGKSRSLNRALAAAAGDLLVFTDDDVVHPADWLERLTAAAEAHPEAEVFGGRVIPDGEVPAWIRRSANLQGLLLCAQDLGPISRPYPPGAYPFGPNFAVRRKIVESRQARWPEDLGPGTSLPIGDEYGFLARISAPDANDRLFVPDAVVHHRVPTRYLSFRGALRRSLQAGIAAGRLHRRHGPIRGSQPAKRAMQRLVGLRSLRELTCVTARAFGVICGRYLVSPRRP